MKIINRQSTIVNRQSKIIISFLFLMSISSFIFAQEELRFPLNDDSYVSYPMGEHLVFEGQIAPNYTVAQWGNKNSDFAGAIVVTPKVMLKMYRTRSSPVKTPSYMPKITLHAVWKSGSMDLYPYFILSHHSNGQGGETFTMNNEQLPMSNTESGSFATNFVQAGYYFSIGGFENHLIGLSYEHHPVHGWWFGIDPVIQDIYGRKRLHYDYKYLGNVFQVDVNYVRIIDNPDGTPSGIFSATAKIKSPLFKKTMWFFASYYQGQDYYNINFTNKVKQFKTGIAVTTKLLMI